ncbi:MAG: transporter substrate-binding domain-containing protein, partial [Helicobacteraceae bacterium]|nr:transporter substrate-binding domain-containing protein [Helicobacteraceae bacterium]
MLNIFKFIVIVNLVFLNHLFAKDLEKVSLQLQWLDQFQFAGYYVAKEKGFYTDVGLDVEIKKFNDNISPADEVVSKKATYGVGRSSLILDKSRGSDITILSAIFQSSPSIILALKDANIQNVQDFKNKKIMSNHDSVAMASMYAMMNQNGVSTKDMIKLKNSFDIYDLINKKTDLILAYISNEPYLLKEKQIEYTIFDPKDYGFSFYSDILFTHSDEIKNNKQRTINFNDASIKGWEHAFSHIDETVDLILKKYNSQNKSREALIYEANELKKLAYLKTKELGHIDKTQIQKIYDTYNVMGVTKNKIDLDTFIFHNDKERLNTFTPEEITYLNNKKKLTVCVKKGWEPYENLQNGKFVGISADYLNLYSKKISIPLEIIQINNQVDSLKYLKNGKCDIKPLIATQIKTNIPYNPTQAHFSDNIVLVTKINTPYIQDLNILKDKKVLLIKGFNRFNKYLKKRYPNLIFKEVDNINTALQAVYSENAFGYITTALTASYHIQNGFSTKLKIVNNFETFHFAIGVLKSEPLLLSSLNKAINATTKIEDRKILNTWVATVIESKKDYTVLIKFSVLFIFILLVILYFLEKQQKLNKKLKETQQSFDLGEEISDFGVWTLNHTTNTLKWTSGVHRIFNTDSNSFEPSFENFIAMIHVDDRILLKTTYQNSVQKKEDYMLEHRIVVDGEIKYVEERCQNFYNTKGDILKSVGTVLDITQRKLLEDKFALINVTLEEKIDQKVEELEKSKILFENIFETVKDGIAILDLESNFLLVNNSYEKMTGFTREELYKKSCIGLTVPEMIETSKIIVAKVIENNFFTGFEKQCIAKNNTIIDVRMDLVLMPDKKSILIVVKDITEEIQFKKEKNLQNQQLLHQSRLAQMGEMISMIAHQWRQPLNAISLTSNNLQFKL